MSFPGTHREIIEMAKQAMLETRMARSIVRKAGIRPGGTAQGIPSAGLLLSMTQMGNTFDPWQWSISVQEGVIGFWPTTRPDALGWPASTQHALIYLQGLSYTRVVLLTGGQTGNPSTGLVAFVPIYTTTMTPMSQGNMNPESLQIWVCPDGRTLYEWHLDSEAGGPKAFSWPPAGSCIYTTSTSGNFAGRWAPPPLEELGASSVLLGVGVISRVGPTEDSGLTQKFITGVQVIGIPEEWNTDGFQTFYAGLGQIDE